MEIRFRIAVEVPDDEPGQEALRYFLILLSTELIRTTAHIDGHQRIDKALKSVADLLTMISPNRDV